MQTNLFHQQFIIKFNMSYTFTQSPHQTHWLHWMRPVYKRNDKSDINFYKKPSVIPSLGHGNPSPYSQLK